MTTLPVAADLSRDDRHDEANSRFPQFCERTQNHSLLLQKSLCSENHTERVHKKSALFILVTGYDAYY
jgi:hypothetical protein